MTDPAWRADLDRYPRRAWLKEQSIPAIAVYRFGRRLDRRADGPVKRLLTPAYWVLFRAVETVTGISLPKAARIGPGLRIWHFGNIFVHPDAEIGANCTLRQGVTIGNRRDGGPVPRLGDDVEVGAYAQILGGVRVGRGARIGAMAVVLGDVPAGAAAVGNPARLIETRPEGGGIPRPGPSGPGSLPRGDKGDLRTEDGGAGSHRNIASDPAEADRPGSAWDRESSSGTP